MDVNVRSSEVSQPVSQVSSVNSANTGKPAISNQPDVSLRGAANAKNNEDTNNSGKEIQKLSREDAQTITHEMNKFFQMIDADLQFAMHDRTNQLMVQVVDTKENKVLREFPSHELLDTIANIRDYVGVLLDKKV